MALLHLDLDLQGETRHIRRSQEVEQVIIYDDMIIIYSVEQSEDFENH